MICLPPLAKQYFPYQRRSQIEIHMVLSEPKLPPPHQTFLDPPLLRAPLEQNWPTSQTSSVVNAEKYEYLKYFRIILSCCDQSQQKQVRKPQTNYYCCLQYC